MIANKYTQKVVKFMPKKNSFESRVCAEDCNLGPYLSKSFILLCVCKIIFASANGRAPTIYA